MIGFLQDCLKLKMIFFLQIYLVFEEEFWDIQKDFESFEFLWLDSYIPEIKSDKCQKKTRVLYSILKPSFYTMKFFLKIHLIHAHIS